VALAVLGVSAAPLVGCGGGAPGSLSEAAYVRRATDVCRESRRRIASALDSLGKGRRDLRAAGELASTELEEVVLPGFRSQYQELRELPIPAGDAHFLRLMQSKFAASLAHGEESLARLFRIKRSGYSEFAEATLMAREYGIDGCGSLGRSPRAVLAGF